MHYYLAESRNFNFTHETYGETTQFIFILVAFFDRRLDLHVRTYMRTERLD